jgi:membrane protease subunit HflC
MMQEVRADLNGAAESLGLSIRDVRIRRTDLTQEVSSQTFQRMRAERLAEAELIRARGNEAGQRRRAIADREVVEFVSEAQKDSEILRGQGDAERNRIFAEAFQRDPSFFEFYRSMRAYVSALGDNNTTMVLSPDSDFFKFFESPDGRSAPPAGAAASTPAAPAN